MKKTLTLSLLAISSLAAQAQWDGTFELTPGPLNGQDGWTAPAQATIAPAPLGMSGNALSLAGSPTSAMNDFAVNTFAGTPSSWSMDMSMAQGVGTNPAELFVRFNGWSSYVAIKRADQADPATGLVEVPGGSLTGLTIPFDTTLNIGFAYTVTTGIASAIDVSINGAPAGTISGLNINMDLGPSIEIRSQKVQSYMDNFTVVPEPSTFALLTGLGILGLVFWRRRCR